jgi:hypothetical protein
MFNHDKDEQQQSRPLADRIDESEEDVESMRSSPTNPSWLLRRWMQICLVVLFLATNLISGQIGARWAVALVDLDGECAAHTTQYCRLL